MGSFIHPCTREGPRIRPCPGTWALPRAQGAGPRGDRAAGRAEQVQPLDGSSSGRTNVPSLALLSRTLKVSGTAPILSEGLSVKWRPIISGCSLLRRCPRTLLLLPRQSAGRAGTLRAPQPACAGRASLLHRLRREAAARGHRISPERPETQTGGSEGTGAARRSPRRPPLRSALSLPRVPSTAPQIRLGGC